MRRPNILILYTDQQRWDALGTNGNADIRTPHLDRLAAEGVNFDHCFVQNPVCMPSRASFLTGQYPSALRITHMGVPVPPDTITLPRMVSPYGYRSANIGKLHFLPHANRDHREPYPDYGFDQLEIADEPGPYEDAYRAWVRRKAPEHLDAISSGLPPAAAAWREMMDIRDGVAHPAERFPLRAQPFRGPNDLTYTAFVAEQTLEFIGAHRERPWLCVAGFYSPHSPWIAPQEYLDLYDPARLTIPPFPGEVDAVRAAAGFDDDVLRAARHGYYAMVSEVDAHVGRILARLDELGLADDTLIVFTSDHGDWLGEYLRWGKGRPGDDAVSRVPLIVRWPHGIGRPGRTVEAIVEAVCVVPTLLEAAGIQPPAQLQGRSLLPLMGGADATEGGWDAALLENAGWKTLRTRRFRYLVDASGHEELYDLERDPHEYRDVAGDPSYAGELAESRRLLLQRLVASERPLPRAWRY